MNSFEPTPVRDMTNVPYDPEWPVHFAKISRILKSALGEECIAIEHVGSTAVPGLSAKPKIDMDVVIDSMSHFSAVSRLLEGLGYYPQGDLGRTDREAFGRQDDRVPFDGVGTVQPKHNLYVCTKESSYLREHLAFRDYLRVHPEAALAYSALKNGLAERDRYDQEAYVAGKTEFIRGILVKAGA